VVKSLTAAVLVTFGGLLALFIDLHMIDVRSATLLVAILIIIYEMRVDYRLGDVTYLIWMDYFSIVLVMLLIVGLAEAVYVHRLILNDRLELACIVDKTCRQVICYGLFPIVIAAMILHGQQFNVAAVAALLVGIFLITAGGTWRVTAEMRARRRNRADLSSALAQCSPDDEERYVELLEKTFLLYDVDSSGYLEPKEVDSILRDFFPKMSAKRRRGVITSVSFGEKGCGKEAFVEEFESWKDEARRATDGATSRSRSGGLTRMVRKGLTLPTLRLKERPSCPALSESAV